MKQIFCKKYSLMAIRFLIIITFLFHSVQVQASAHSTPGSFKEGWKWGMLVLTLAILLIIGRRGLKVHRRLRAYSSELEYQNKKLNQKLQFTQAQLAQSERLAILGGVVAGIAHDINTHVGTSITAASYLAKETNHLTTAYQNNEIKKSYFENYLNICNESTIVLMTNLTRASELIRSFKIVAADQSHEERRIFHVKEYLNEVLLSLKPNLKKTLHHITLNCPEGLEIDSYPGLFSQMVTNLVMNSLIHAYDEGDAGSITIHITDKANALTLIYADDGKGISNEHLDKIFEPFFTTKRDMGGTGLGLSIIHSIVTQKLKGTIRCESEPGRGTTFSIEIPVEKKIKTVEYNS
ncbi:MAG: HAMP domain-containing histidine kinase [Firmicutes bacterium]|nr:HAMP domain-containing histidine kinase [Bacillota bacterium]